MKGLKIQRIKKELTQEQLAKVMGLSVRQITSYEQGVRQPKLDTLKELAKFFDCTIEELL